MPITYCSQKNQSTLVNEYNENQTSKKNKIPLVPRNLETGWPLLQVSLFDQDINNPKNYAHVLGGGKCHFFFIGAYHFARLLAEVPATKTIIKAHNNELTLDKFQPLNIPSFMNEWVVNKTGLGSIKQESGSYGKSLDIDFPSYDTENLRESLRESFDYSVKNKSNLEDITTEYFSKNPSYTSDQIKNGLNEDKAVFKDGQIFVDLGMLLKHYNVDKNLIETLKQMFKVDEFKYTIADKIELKDSDVEQNVDSIEIDTTINQPEKKSNDITINQSEKKSNVTKALVDEYNNSIVNAKTKITAMIEYGTQLKNKKKGGEVVSLGIKLNYDLNNYSKLIAEGTVKDTQDIKDFKEKFIKDLRSLDNTMSGYKEWKQIVGNIAIACIPVLGLAAILIKLAIGSANAKKNNEPVTAKNLFFFGPGKVHSHVNEIIDAIVPKNVSSV